MRVGVIDIQWPGWMPKLVPVLEELGYSRYWATEHHGPVQSASPTLVTALAAGLSEEMRVGTAGVLLRVQSPLRVVEDFKLLQLLFPGRLDLGIAGAVPPEPFRSALLDGRSLGPADEYGARVGEVVRLLRGEATDGALPAHSVGPRCEGIPEIWLCGTSEGSGLLAASLGIAFSFHDYLVTKDPAASPAVFERGPAAVRGYVRHFRENASMPSPRFNVACYGICADSRKEADALWNGFARRDTTDAGSSREVRPSFCGAPSECRDQLQAIANRYGADELIIQSLAPDLDSCLHSYELLAYALGLKKT